MPRICGILLISILKSRILKKKTPRSLYKKSKKD